VPFSTPFSPLSFPSFYVNLLSARLAMAGMSTTAARVTATPAARMTAATSAEVTSAAAGRAATAAVARGWPGATTAITRPRVARRSAGPTVAGRAITSRISASTVRRTTHDRLMHIELRA